MKRQLDKWERVRADFALASVTIYDPWKTSHRTITNSAFKRSRTPVYELRAMDGLVDPANNNPWVTALDKFRYSATESFPSRLKLTWIRATVIATAIAENLMNEAQSRNDVSLNSHVERRRNSLVGGILLHCNNLGSFVTVTYNLTRKSIVETYGTGAAAMRNHAKMQWSRAATLVVRRRRRKKKRANHGAETARVYSV